MMNIPNTVKAAIALYWTSFIIGWFNPAIYENFGNFPSPWTAYAFFAVMIVFALLMGAFISWKLIQGFNWARMFIAIVSILSFAMLLTTFPGLKDSVKAAYLSPLGMTITSLTLVLTATVTVLLFLPASNAWFDLERDERPKLPIEISKKSRLVALLLCVFLGGFGIHRFYAGRIISGALMLVPFLVMVAGFVGLMTMLLNAKESSDVETLAFAFGSGIGLVMVVNVFWVIIDIILISCGVMKDGNNARIVNWNA